MTSPRSGFQAILLALLWLLPLRGQAPAVLGAARMPVLAGARLTVLVDNRSRDPALKAEYGASFFLEAGEHRILFDTGPGRTIQGNAKALGIDFQSLEAIVLSHHHHDHTGGLGQVLALSGPVRLFVHPAAFETHYWSRGAGPPDRLAMPIPRTRLAQLGATLVETKGPTEICPGVMVTGEIPRQASFEDTGVSLQAFLDPEATIPDPIRDDQALFFRAPGGLVVVLGCGHAGVVNTLDYVCQLTGESRVLAVIGGTHLLEAGPDRMSRTLAAFKGLQVQRIRLSHCTGARAQAAFDEAFPGRCRYPSVGTRLTFGTPAGE